MGIRSSSHATFSHLIVMADKQGRKGAIYPILNGLQVCFYPSSARDVRLDEGPGHPLFCLPVSVSPLHPSHSPETYRRPRPPRVMQMTLSCYTLPPPSSLQPSLPPFGNKQRPWVMCLFPWVPSNQVREQICGDSQIHIIIVFKRVVRSSTVRSSILWKNRWPLFKAEANRPC